MLKKRFIIITLPFILLSCTSEVSEPDSPLTETSEYFIEVLGIAQDAGFPQAGCMKTCCKELWDRPDAWEKVASIGIVDKIEKKSWMVDATPDFKAQMNAVTSHHEITSKDLDGIFLTHAHIGHYTGLINLGREVMGSQNIPVFALPRMHEFIQTNGPWDQLVSLNNIKLNLIQDDSIFNISAHLSIQPMIVPHRDEYSETAAYLIRGQQKKLLYIPDIDKWGKWNKNIKEMIPDIDYALLDASFFQNGEIPGRDMSEIPHPFVKESMELFEDLSSIQKSKIYFTHFNHTNPILNRNSSAYKEVIDAGFNIAFEGMKLYL